MGKCSKYSGLQEVQKELLRSSAEFSKVWNSHMDIFKCSVLWNSKSKFFCWNTSLPFYSYAIVSPVIETSSRSSFLNIMFERAQEYGLYRK
jgi:hypothetical protein